MDPSLNTVASDAASTGVHLPVDGADEAARTPLGALLVAEGFINDTQLAEALRVGRETAERVGEVVVRQGLASEEDIARLLADQWDLSYVDRASIWFDGAALTRLSREDAQRIEAMPTRVQDGRVVVAVAEPTVQRLAALRAVIGDDTIVVVVPKSALDAGLKSELLASDGRGTPLNGSDKQRTKASPILPATDDSNWGEDDLADVVGRELARPARPERRADPARPAVSREAPGASPLADQHAPHVTGTLAQSLAELIEAQIGASRTASADDTERFVALEQRIEQLENELEANRTALAEVGNHLQAIAVLLGKLSAR